MSAQYTAEPPTEGTLEIITTHGPLHMGLWPHDAPKAARLFAQHIASNAYGGLPFHRIVPDLLVQSGNIPASREKSTYPVRAERNTRLRFRRRALVALVSDADDEENAGHEGVAKSRKNSAKRMGTALKTPVVHDQFFITLADAPFLNGRHPIVATVVGESVFNLLNIAAHGAVNDPNNEDVPRILGTSLTLSPFVDLQVTPAATRELATAPSETSGGVARLRQKSAHKPVRSRAPGIRSDSLLSFRADQSGEGDEDDDDDDDGDLNRQFLRRPVQPRKALRPALTKDSLSVKKPVTVNAAPTLPTSDANLSGMNNGDSNKANVIANANAEFERLKRELLGHSEREANKEGSSGTNNRSATSVPKISNGTTGSSTAGLGVVDAKVRKRRRRADEGDVLRRLQAFESRLAEARRRQPGSPSISRSSTGAGSSGGCEARQLETSSSVSLSAGEAMDVSVSGTREELRSPGTVGTTGSSSKMAIDNIPSGRNERAPWFATSLRLKPPDDDLLDYDVVDHAGNAPRHQRQRRPR